MNLPRILTGLFAVVGWACLSGAEEWLNRLPDTHASLPDPRSLVLYAVPSLLVVLASWLTRRTPGPAWIVTLVASVLAGWSVLTARSVIADDEIGLIRLGATVACQVFVLVAVLPVPLSFCLRRRLEPGRLLVSNQ